MAYIGSPAAPAIATVSDGTVTSAKLADDAVTSAKLDTNIAVDGNLTVDTNTLYVDSTNNRVGIGTSSPSDALDVTGDIKSSGQISGKIWRTDVLPVLAQNQGGGVIAPLYSDIFGTASYMVAAGYKTYWVWYIPDDCNEINSVDLLWFQGGNPTSANQGEVNFTTRVVINTGFTLGTNTTSTLTLTNTSNGQLRENTIAGSTILPTQTPGRAVLIEGEFDFAVGGAGAYNWQFGPLVINWR